MIGTSRQIRVFACPYPVDMRKSYEGLAGIVRNDLARDPMSGDLHLFCNRRRNRAKVLLWDGTGLAIYMKRLEKGLFAQLWRDESRKELLLSVTELQLFLEGSNLVGRATLSPSPLPSGGIAIVTHL